MKFLSRKALLVILSLGMPLAQASDTDSSPSKFKAVLGFVATATVLIAGKKVCNGFRLKNDDEVNRYKESWLQPARDLLSNAWQEAHDAQNKAMSEAARIPRQYRFTGDNLDPAAAIRKAQDFLDKKMLKYDNKMQDLEDEEEDELERLPPHSKEEADNRREGYGMRMDYRIKKQNLLIYSFDDYMETLREWKTKADKHVNCERDLMRQTQEVDTYLAPVINRLKLEKGTWLQRIKAFCLLR